MFFRKLQELFRSKAADNQNASEFVLVPKADAANLLKTSLGEEFLRYILNLDESSDINEKLVNLPDDQLCMLTQMMILAIPVIIDNPDLSTIPGTFSRRISSNDTVANQFRRANGGAVETPVVFEDDLLQYFSCRIRELLPSLKIREYPISSDTQARQDRLANFISDDLAELESVLLKEPAVNKLLASISVDPCDPIGSVFIFAPPCIMGNLALPSIKQALLHDTLYELSIIEPDMRGASDSIRSSLSISANRFREILSGTETGIQVAVIFSNVIPSNNSPINIAGDVLAKPSSFEKRFIIPQGLNEPLVLRTSMNIRMAAVGGSEVQLDNPSSMQSFLNQVSKADLNMSEFNRIMDQVTLLRTSMILSSVGTSLARVRYCGSYFSNPLIPIKSHISTHSSNEVPLRHGPTEFDNARLTEWFQLLEHSKIPSNALRRFVRAIADRESLEDSFVDLMIFVESLFSENQDTTFKISLCVSKILGEENREARQAKFRKMKMLYKTRSAIVHGRQAALGKLDQQLSELEDIAVDLLKSLLTTHAFVLETKLENRIELLALE